MKCKATILDGIGQEWSVEEIEVDPRKAGDVDDVGDQATRDDENIRGVVVHAP